MNTISVSMVPMFFEPPQLRGYSAVVIDILRASTTITHALAHGATAVIPTEHVDQARTIAATFPHNTRLLGGERKGVKIDGFDLDNSPFSYPSERVAGKTIIFTTTNGTFALQKCTEASRTFIGCFLNLSAIVDQLLKVNKPIHLVCAGTNRQLTAEDILFAGAVVDRVLTTASDRYQAETIETQMALDFYRSHPIGTAAFRSAMFESLGGTNLVRLKLEADIERAMQVDLFSIVPEWDPSQNLITVNS